MTQAKSALQKDKDRLAKDFKKIISDAEGLLGSLSGEMDEKAEEAKERLEHSLAEAKEKFHELDQKLVEAAHKAEEQVKEHPLASLGVAFGAGMLLTLLLSRRTQNMDVVTLLTDVPRSLRQASSLGVALLRNRVELFSLELKEERLRLVGLLLWGGAGLLLGMVGLVLAALAIIYAVPPPFRWGAAALCALVFLGGAAIALAVVHSRLNRAEPPFARTLAELHKDSQAL
eukprot:TRINITY_DN5610_c0_g3_i1.p3 TRINITY_DN5610_c0_g3~~TRINITY_DN5610_c0_g3_i1.p3  ORF type:complete len:230 (+),score=106.48 TRINITY_DN5610_c0_g3_i1:1715-2404(+)